MNKAGIRIHLDYAKTMGITGTGIGAAVMDTGIAPHPDFEANGNRLAAFYDVVNRKDFFYDDSGHGTHVSGIIAGDGFSSNGKYCGVAPGCHLIGVKVLDRHGNGSIPDALEGIRWILAHRKKYNIRIVNISVGGKKQGKNSENLELIQAVESLWKAGIVVVAAAGNEGPAPSSIGLPGCSKKIITVGACDDTVPVRLSHREMVNYSGRGPTEECVLKPDIVAPGGHIISCVPISNSSFPKNGALTVRNQGYGFQRFYGEKSGTSMATPMVSGAVALLLEKYPEMTNREVKIRLKNTSTDLGMPHSQQGWGLLDIENLLK
jgi:serine protease AprX